MHRAGLHTPGMTTLLHEHLDGSAASESVGDGFTTLVDLTDAEPVDLVDADNRRLRLWHGPHRWLQLTGSPWQGADEPLAQMLRASAMRPPSNSRPPEHFTVVGRGRLAAAVVGALGGLAGRSVFLGADGRPPELWQAGACERGEADWSVRLPEEPGVVVVASATLEPDRALLAHLVHAGHQHVVVRAHGHCALVGPWVVPGHTPCQGCQDRWLAASDPHYTRVVAELGCRRARPGPGGVAWAAGVLAGHASRPDGGAQSLAGVVQVLDHLDPHLTEQRFEAHPDCACLTRR